MNGKMGRNSPLHIFKSAPGLIIPFFLLDLYGEGIEFREVGVGQNFFFPAVFKYLSLFEKNHPADLRDDLAEIVGDQDHAPPRGGNLPDTLPEGMEGFQVQDRC